MLHDVITKFYTLSLHDALPISGATEAKIAAIDDESSDLLSPRERAAIRFAEKLAVDHRKVRRRALVGGAPPLLGSRDRRAGRARDALHRLRPVQRDRGGGSRVDEARGGPM